MKRGFPFEAGLAVFGFLHSLRLLLVGLLLMGGALFSPAHAQESCGSLASSNGPYDYNDRAAREGPLQIVEKRHFTQRVKNLEGGESGYLASDIAYTLNRFPNHHQALDAMARLAVREDTMKPRHSQWSIECWFDRAIRFAPEDGMVRVVQGLYYYRLEEFDTAVEHLERAIELEPNNYQAHYNLGLVLARVGKHQAALPHAKRAYELGHPLPGLRRILEQEGYSLAE